MRNSGEQGPKTSEKGLVRLARSVINRALPSIQESPASNHDITEFVPSPAFTGLKPTDDVIIVNRSEGSKNVRAPLPGARLEMSTDYERAEADRANLRIDGERTRFLADIAHVLTYPYVDLFDRMIPWAPERRGLFRRDQERTVTRTDNFNYDDIKMNYRTNVAYILKDGGKHLSRVNVFLGNNLTSDIRTPRLEMLFDEGRMASVKLSFDENNQGSLQMLTGQSLLGKYLKGQYAPVFGRGRNPASLRINLGEEMGIAQEREEVEGYRSEISTFSWEPRQKILKRYTAYDKDDTPSPIIWEMTQSQFLQLLRDVLALVPTAEKGSLDFARKQRPLPQAKSLIKLMGEVEKLPLPLGEQFEALLRMMKEDSRQMYLQMGIDLNVGNTESSVDKFGSK